MHRSRGRGAMEHAKHNTVRRLHMYYMYRQAYSWKQTDQRRHFQVREDISSPSCGSVAWLDLNINNSSTTAATDQRTLGQLCEWERRSSVVGCFHAVSWSLQRNAVHSLTLTHSLQTVQRRLNNSKTLIFFDKSKVCLWIASKQPVLMFFSWLVYVS